MTQKLLKIFIFTIYSISNIYANNLNTDDPIDQNNSLLSEKKYEVQTIKNKDQIEIRLIPKKNLLINSNKNTDDYAEGLLNEQFDNDETLESSEDSAEKSPYSINQSNESNNKSLIIYEKSTGKNDFDESDLKKKNNVRSNNIEIWREKQKKLREDRIKKRNEESRTQYLKIKNRSVIKETNEERLKKVNNQQDQNLSSQMQYYNQEIKPSSSDNNNSLSPSSNQNSSSLDSKSNPSINSSSNNIISSQPSDRSLK